MFGRIAVITLVIGLPLAAHAEGDAPNFSGDWKIAPSQSGYQNLSLHIEQNSNQVKFSRTDHDAVSRFVCTVGGGDCEFDEHGHKATVSLWFNGPVLVILKTNGAKEDPTIEWHLALQADGKTLNVKREDVSTNKSEDLTFTKTDSVAAR